MTIESATANERRSTVAEPPELSPSLGGPLYRLYQRTGLLRRPLERVALRAATVAALAWVPLFVLSLVAGAGEGVPFLLDLEAQLRFLVALPLLVGAEIVAHSRVTATVEQFCSRGLIADSERPRFDAAIASTVRIRDSLALEAGLVLFVLTAGHWIWREQIALDSATWYAVPAPNGLALTPTGTWYAFVSVPIFQFLLFRWLARMALWFSFLWRVSRLDLRLTPAHPDRAGGLGFVGTSTYAFSLVLAAQGVMLAGMIANRILHEGRALVGFKVDAIGLVGAALFLFLAPLAVFSPHLARAKRRGLREYGELASRYVREFDSKWIHGSGEGREPLLGSGDVQSLADLANGYAVIQEMRLVPFGWQTISRLALITAAPLLPLTLTAIPLEELIDRVVATIL